jgi:hypothetical protein
MTGIGSDRGSGTFNDGANLGGFGGGDSSLAFQGEVNTIRSGSNSLMGTAFGEAQKGWADFSCAIFDGNNPPEITNGSNGQQSQNSSEDIYKNSGLVLGLASTNRGDALSEAVKNNLASQISLNGTIDVRKLMDQTRRQLT